MNWVRSLIDKLQALWCASFSKGNITPWDILRTIQAMSGRDQQMPIELDLIIRETGLSKMALKRRLRQLSNSDLVFFEGGDVLLSYSGLYHEQ